MFSQEFWATQFRRSRPQVERICRAPISEGCAAPEETSYPEVPPGALLTKHTLCLLPPPPLSFLSSLSLSHASPH